MATEPATGNVGSEDQPAPPEAVGKEHRNVSVLMVDLVGSSDLMEALGHEDYGALLERFHELCGGIVEAHGGVVTEYLGDGALCYFGLQRANEDDAANAVAAALELVGQLETRFSDGAPIKVRLGVSSGSVMVNANADVMGASAVGTCVHRAARLQELAEAGTVLICDDTRRLTGQTFHLKEFGVVQLRGIGQPQPVFQAIKARTGLTTRFHSLRGHLAGDLVGRTAELAKLHEMFVASGESGGRAVTVVADAGIGKSRLIQAFLDSQSVKGAPSFVLQCSPEHLGTSLYPVVRYLDWVAGGSASDTTLCRSNKLQRLLREVWKLDDDDADLLTELICPSDDAPSESAEPVHMRRERALGLLADQFFASVKGRGAFVVVFEDIHWLDPTSAQLLEMLIARATAFPVLIILSTRQEPPYGNGLAAAPALRLASLSTAESQSLAKQLLGADGPTDVLVEKSEGVPLILQEYAEIMLETGGEALRTAQVPVSLASVIQSKLDRLDAQTRSLVRAGSAWGRSFDPALVARLSGLGNAPIATMVAELRSLNLVLPSDGIEDTQVVFTHALVRDAVYGNMPGADRLRIHGAIADAFLKQTDMPPVEDHVLAGHLSKAKRFEAATDHYVGAALAAAKKGAAAEALVYLKAGLDGIKSLPEGQARDHLELRLLAVQGPTLMIARGPGGEEFGRTQARAMDLVERLDVLEERLPVVFYTAEHAWAVADLDRAETMADAILMLDAESPSDAAHLAGNLLKGMVAWHRGDNILTMEAMGRVMSRYDMETHKALYAHFIKEFGVFSHFYAGLTRTIQGAFDEGLALAEGAVRLSDALQFPHERGFALLARFNTAMLRDDVVTADLASTEALAFSVEQGFPEFISMAQFTQGWCQARRGHTAEGVAMMEVGFDGWRQTGFTCWQALFVAILAPYLIELDRIPEASDLVAHHLAEIENTGEDQCRAPLLLAQAMILAKAGQMAESDEVARSALSVAQAQGAVLWERWVRTAFPTV